MLTILILITVLRDEHFNDINYWAYGNFEHSHNNDDSGTDLALDWFDLSTFTDHLKTGGFCSATMWDFGRDLSIPLGMFCMEQTL